MIIIFKDKDLQQLIETGKSKKYKAIAKDKKLVQQLADTYNAMAEAENINVMAKISFLHYEKLKHSYSGKSSVRPFGKRRVERLIFTENDNKIEITILEMEDNHYGNKK